MSEFLTAIVIPCLNEERTLATTCRSLGFAAQHESPRDTVLILVDNGSIDATLAVAQDVKSQSVTDAVVIASEAERGYVPPRRRGNVVAMNLAMERGVSLKNLLIIQADADTIYGQEYAEALSRSAQSQGLGVLIDARSECQPEFVVEHREYVALCNQVDSEFDSLLSDATHDVIIDDKACAYWASDYELWGGHQREYTTSGDGFRAETTRLFIRAKTYGARRYLCEDAVAQHSARRILPSLFSTSSRRDFHENVHLSRNGSSATAAPTASLTSATRHIAPRSVSH